MKPNLHSILSKGWFDSTGEVPSTQSPAIQGWGAPNIGNEDWRNYPAMPSYRWNKEDSVYDPEANLYEMLLMEAFNIQGSPCKFFVVDYDLDRDRFLGEDQLKNVSRMFEVQIYFELPKEEEVVTLYGIEGFDRFSMYASVKHFDIASRADQYGKMMVHEPYTPKESDIIYTKYNDKYYKITHVKKMSNKVYRRIHCYEMVVQPMKDENMQVSASIAFDPFENYQAIADIFNVSASAESEKDIQRYNPPANEGLPDPFVDW